MRQTRRPRGGSGAPPIPDDHIRRPCVIAPAAIFRRRRNPTRWNPTNLVPRPGGVLL